MGRLTRVLLAGFACPAKRQPISRSVFLYIALVALSMSDTESYSYAKAGVDIAAGNALVRAIAPLAKATRRPGADAELGGFGGFFDLKAAGYDDPLLVAANDGVGTKLTLAIDRSEEHTSEIQSLMRISFD